MSHSITNYSEIQQDEIEALRSIYPEDFVEEATKFGAWNKALDRAFRVRLRTNLGENDKNAITLSISLPPTYPKSLPKLGLHFGDDVREKTRITAENMIRQKPKTLLGSEMIYDLTTALQDILDDVSQNNAKDLPTLDEERATREEAARVKLKEMEAESRLQAAQMATDRAVDQENELLQALVEQERARAARRKATANSDAEGPIPRQVPAGLSFDRPSATTVKDPAGRTFYVGAVSHKLLYQKGPAALLSLVEPWPRSEQIECEAFLILKECHCQGNEPIIKKRLQELESCLDSQMRATVHPSVIKPVNFRIQRSNEELELTGSVRWTISILSEFTSKGSLKDFLSIANTLDATRAKAWSMQLLEGLHHYHQQGSAHGRVHLANILLWDSEALTTVARWSDGAYAHLLNLLTSHNRPVNSLGWTAPEVLAGENEQILTTSIDVWNFGVCLLQMAFSQNVLQEYEGPPTAISQLGLTQSLRSLLTAVFNPNAKKRPSAWDLLHFEFFRNEDEYLADISGTHPTTSSRLRRESQAPADSSEYARKFVEEGRLGRGGFGEVFRARNKTDGQLYAVKKVKAKSRSALDPVLSEATVLSRLNHPNVVRYFTSWIEEDVIPETSSALELDSSLEAVAVSTNSLGFQPVLLPSFRGLDFISSNNIVFGDPDNGSDGIRESDSESSESDDLSDRQIRRDIKRHDFTSSRDTDQSASDVWTTAPKGSAWTMLYIQMEYCKQETLRDLINTGIQSNVTECWRLFRQIVQGLAHIHSASIVHRDLKPENIFIDSSGDLRIGDFGLARPGEYRMPESSKDPSMHHPGSFTKDVGTAWYVAPEVRSSGVGKYDQRADMYSLGIIFLEMNVPFATGMERATALDPLAKENHKLPSGLAIPEKNTQARILMSLIEYQPSQRPNCPELLDQIPVQDEDQMSRLVRRELRDPTSRLRTEYVGALFSAPSTTENGAAMFSVPPDLVQKIRLLEGVGAMSRKFADLEMQSKVKRQLTTIFRWHGAIERTDSPAVFPHHPCYAASDVVRMLDIAGNTLQLPYDLVLPNAMLLAQSMRPEAKTFAYGDVYRPDPRKDDPNIFGEADFDIVEKYPTNLALGEAEVMKVIDEILDTFPNLSNTTMCYHINHSRLLDKILDICDVETGKWFAVKETMSKLNTADWTWTRIRHELRAPPISMTSTSLDELEPFVFRDPIEKAVPKLRSMMQSTADVESAFAHLNSVVTYLSRMNVKRRVYLNPLSSYNEKFYSGNMFFQCLYDRKRIAVFAAGGRYDALIHGHQPLPSRDSSIHGVGFQMTWSGLCTGMVTYLNAQSKSKGKRKPQIERNVWNTRRCEVLVDCYDTDLLDKIGVRILSELWASQISAELSNAGGSTAASTAYTKSALSKEDHSWIILVKSPDLVKVKSLSRQDETEVRTTDLAHHLRSEIRERDRNEGRPSAIMMRHDSQPEGASNLADRETDVIVIMSSSKGKKANRKTIVEEALAKAQEWRTSSLEDPIIAIETRDEIFQSIRHTSLDDSETWRRLIQAAPAGERQYLGQLQELLREQKGSKAAFIYNFRTKAILYYPVGKG